MCGAKKKKKDPSKSLCLLGNVVLRLGVGPYPELLPPRQVLVVAGEEQEVVLELRQAMPQQPVRPLLLLPGQGEEVGQARHLALPVLTVDLEKREKK